MKRISIILVTLFSFCCAQSVVAETVRDRLEHDADFPMYAVIFGVTLDENGEIENFRIAEVTNPQSGTTDPVKVDVPVEYVEKAKKKPSEQYQRSLEGRKREEFYTYFYYSPLYPEALIDDLESDIQNL